MAQLKTVFLHQFNYHYHPLVMAQLERQEFELSSDRALHHLSDEHVALILFDIVLHATFPNQEGSYPLLNYCPIFELIKQHPAAKKLPISLRLHKQDTQTIIALSLLKPALTHRYSSLSAKTILQRQRLFKTFTSKADLPTASALKQIMHQSPCYEGSR